LAERMLRAANQQRRRAIQVAQGSAPSPLWRVASQQPAGASAKQNLNKI
jgi:hypothetical protein